MGIGESIGESIKEQVFSQLEKGRICVFPTEAMRRFYLASFAADPRHGMVFESQTMAWDDFNKMFLKWDQSLRPSDFWTRRLFAALFVSSRAAVSLRRFAIARYDLSKEGLASHLAFHLASILPRIPLAVERAEGALKADLILIRASYEKFLAQRGLCETLWIEPCMPEGFEPAGYAICFPEAIETYPLFESYVDTSRFWFVRGGAVEGRLEVYPNTIAELKAQFRRIRALLDSGVPQSDIAISCADLKSLRPYLEREARLKGVELSIKEGLKLTSYGAGRFFLDLRRVAREDFSLGSLESLLLNPSYPWKEMDKLRFLVETGIFNQVSGGRELWLSKLSSRGREERAFPSGKPQDGGVGPSSRAVGDKEQKSLFLTLCNLIEAFGRCRTVDGIRRAFNAFQDEFFTSQAFEGAGDEEKDVYSYCVRQMEDLEKAMASCAVDELPELFGFFVKALSSITYVQRGKDEGIPVYRYGQGAGLYPAYHFFLNIGARSVRAKRVFLGFLPGGASSDPLISGFDKTDDLLALASRSGGHVYLSGPETGVEGAVLCPPLFLAEGRREKGPETGAADEYKRELAYWAEGRKEGFVPNQLQKDSLAAYCDVGLPFPAAEREDLAVPVRPSEQDGCGEGGGAWPAPKKAGLSASRIDDYLKCPFYWFCVHVLGVEDGNPFVPPSEDPKVFGSLVHAVLERFFIQEGRIDPGKAPMYKERLLGILDDQIKTFKARFPMDETIWLHMGHKIRSRIQKGLDFGPLEGFRAVAAERSVASDRANGSLEGRIDLVFALPDEGGLGVLDLKSGTFKERKSKVNIKDWDEKGLDSVQLLVYGRLLEDSKEPFPVWSAYYSFNDNRFYYGWTSGDLDKAKVEKALSDRAGFVSASVAKGAYGPTPSDASCKYCKFYTACRAKYVVR